nr:hypothetical protein [Marinobacter confluentis]
MTELGYPQKHACHVTGTLPDPLDESGDLFAVFRNGLVIGTCLSNYTKSNNLEYYPSLYKMSRFAKSYKEHASVTTKLVVQKGFRNSSAAFQLALATYLKGLSDGVRYNFIDCDPKMVKFFHRLGYVVHLPEVNHPEFGSGIVMALELRNVERLMDARSPF